MQIIVSSNEIVALPIIPGRWQSLGGGVEVYCFGGEGVSGRRGRWCGCIVPQSVDTGGGQRLFLPPDALHFAYPGVGIEVGHGEKLGAGL